MQKPEHGISLRSSARTSTGQVRQNNEDSIHLWAGDDFVLAIIADGMGGAAAGEEASRIAVETIKAGFNPNDSEDAPVSSLAARQLLIAESVGANPSPAARSLAVPRAGAASRARPTVH